MKFLKPDILLPNDWFTSMMSLREIFLNFLKPDTLLPNDWFTTILRYDVLTETRHTIKHNE